MNELRFRDITVTHRRLPHWSTDNAIYWVTFRLADSIPQEKLALWRKEYATWADSYPQPWDDATWHEYHERFDSRLEDWLDAGTGSCTLARPEIRNVVASSLLYFDGTRITLHGAVIMPTHVHCLIEPADGWTLPKLMKSIKGISANKANKILGNSGTFWQHESYDHIVRNERQHSHYIHYMRENPIKAKLPKEAYWLYVAQEAT